MLHHKIIENGGIKVKRQKLKTRILRSLGILFVLASVITTIFAYIYFYGIVKNQNFRDEEVKIEQMAYQLEFMVTDIVNFSKSIAIDPIIQENMIKTDYSSEFEKTKLSYAVAEKLVFYKSLRNYIGVISLRGEDGNGYSSIGYADEQYFDDKYKLDALVAYQKDENAVFSKPYMAFERAISQDVISYKTGIRNINKTDQIIGDLYLDIHLEYFIRQIRSYSNNYDNVYIMDQNRNIIYIKENVETGFNINEIQIDTTQPSVVEVETGYIIVQPIENAKWIVATFIDNGYLWQQSKFVLRFFLLFFLISIIISLFITSRVLNKMIQPISQLTTTMENIKYDTLEVDLDIRTNDEIELLSIRFKEMLYEINQSVQALIRKEQETKEMEFDILLSQINPHYLYNVLNTVVYLATMNKNKEVVTVVNAMINSLQETLKVGENQIFTNLEAELDFVKNYVTIQSYRFPDIFEVVINCDESLNDTIIPKTIIQPLVENALLHGIIPSEEKGLIRIDVDVKDDVLIIIVKDTGIGVDLNKINTLLSEYQGSENDRDGKKHIGIKNIHDRILYLYGKPYGLQIKNNTDKGASFIITLPCE